MYYGLFYRMEYIHKKLEFFYFSKVRLFSPQIWQQTVRHRGKLNLKFPRPRHHIPRYLEDITKPQVIKEKIESAEICRIFKEKQASMNKATTNYVNLVFYFTILCFTILRYICYNFLSII